MGTRSLTVLEMEDGTEIAVMYRQYDGYPEGHGQELKEFLAGFEIVNGFGCGDDQPIKQANGMDCLAAQIIAHFKTDIGNIYLMPAGTRDAGEEYIYTVKPSNGRAIVRCQDADTGKSVRLPRIRRKTAKP